MLALAVALGGAGGAGAADPVAVSDAVVISLALHGVGELRFGDRLQWRLVIEPPAEVRPGEGIRLGGVSIRALDGRVRHDLGEPPGYSRAEVGGSCEVVRIDAYALIRCARDYVFDTRTGGRPVLVTPQFRDRLGPSPGWLAGLPLPWWRPAGTTVPGTALAFLDYGYVNYGQGVESADIYRGPALLDLREGRIAVARVGAEADSPPYDATAAGEAGPVAVRPEAVVAERVAGGRRTVAVMTVFDRCVAATCRGDSEPGFRRREVLYYRFD